MRFGAEAGADTSDFFSYALGGVHEIAGGQTGENAVMSDGCQGHGGDTAALRAVRSPSELARTYAGFEVSRERRGGAREDTLFGRFRGTAIAFEHDVRHMHLRK